jgi:hypothetical protein
VSYYEWRHFLARTPWRTQPFIDLPIQIRIRRVDPVKSETLIFSPWKFTVIKGAQPQPQVQKQQ